AEKRASKSAATTCADSTATGCGRRCALTASRTVSVSHALARSTCATWPVACTPASVRPAPCTATVSPQNAAIAAVSTPCTDSPLSCICPPTNGAPSYSITSLSRGMATSMQDGTGRNARAAQVLVCRHRPLAGRLQAEDTDRAVAACDRELVVEHGAGRARAVGLRGAQHLHARAADLAPGARKRREA